MATDCLFCKIIDRVIPSTTIYEDDDVIVFNDIKPMAKVHFLIVPKLHIDSLKECDETNKSLLGKMLLLAPKLATEQGLQGFKTLINTGREGGQEVFHIHVHVFGG
mgnify:CR=1 FL=1